MSIWACAVRLVNGGIPMKYMLLIYLAEIALDDSGRQHCYQEPAQLCQDVAASGHYLTAVELHMQAWNHCKGGGPNPERGLACSVLLRRSRAPPFSPLCLSCVFVLAGRG